jgi:cyclopropane fatty-acyl-phospholipid synthase-like methyltransferase
MNEPFQEVYHAVHLPEHPARAVVWRVVAEHLSRWVPADAHVLEIGAGYCHWINAVRGARRVAVDVWPELPRHAGPGVEAIVADVTKDLRALGGQGTDVTRPFDVVLASNLLEHFEPAMSATVVANVASVLRSGGRFIIVQPNFRYAYREYFDDYTHRSIFTDVSLSNLLRSHGFEIDFCAPKFLPYSMREARVPISPFLIKLYLNSPIKPRAGQMLIVARKA